MQFLTLLRNDKFQQSNRSTSVDGPQKHFKPGYVASMGDGGKAVAAAGGEERWLSGRRTSSTRTRPAFSGMFKKCEDKILRVKKNLVTKCTLGRFRPCLPKKKDVYK